MQIVTTHKGTDFDALASVVAANILYPGVVSVLPKNLNPNVRAFLSLHRDLFGFCTPDEVNLNKVDRLIVVDTNSWSRLDRMDRLKTSEGLEILMYDHHLTGDIQANWKCREEMGANITLMIRYLKQQKKSISPIQASLFLAGLYEDTGNLTFPSTRAEDARAAAYLLENRADLNIIGAFVGPVYGQKQKDVLFRMLRKASRSNLDGNTFSVNRIKVTGYVDNLAVVVQMYRQILNVDAAFGIFVINRERCLVIGRSSVDGIDIGAIMRCMGGGGHPGAGSTLLKSVEPDSVETWIKALVEGKHQTSTQIRDLMSFPVLTLPPDISMHEALTILHEKKHKGAPVVEKDRIAGIISRRDFRKIRNDSQLKMPVKAFMSIKVKTIEPWQSPGHAAHLMIKHDIGRLPVIENNQLVGIISRSDAVANFYGLCPLVNNFTTGCNKNDHL